MTTFDRITTRIIQITGGFQVVLGVTFWTGNALPLIPLHMLVGAIFVVALWVLAFRAAFGGAGAGLSALTAGWGVFVIVFGMVQMQILPGPYHWIIRTLHLLVGIAAMALAGRLAPRMMKSRSGRTEVLDVHAA